MKMVQDSPPWRHLTEDSLSNSWQGFLQRIKIAVPPFSAVVVAVPADGFIQELQLGLQEREKDPNLRTL